jgi:uncharacterized protein involved in outer membrane biogenesis
MGRLLYVVVVLAALVAGGAYLVFNYVDVVVKVALEHWGPTVLGASVKVGEVQISVKSGRGAIRNLEIGNPTGFTAARAARFGEIRVATDPSTLTDRLIVIHELAVEAPQITYEKGSKSTNLDVIQSSIDAYVKRATAAAQEKAAEAAPEALKRRFVIERLSIRGGKVLMTTAGLKGQGVSFDLPEIQLRDIGKDKGGVSASEAAALVASTLQNRIAQKVLTNVELLRRGGVEGAVDALKGLLK